MTTPVKGETQGTFRRSRPLGKSSLIGISLTPSLRYTPQAAPMAEGMISRFLLEIFVGRVCVFALVYVFLQRFLIVGHLKISNSLRSDSEIFLTAPLIRNHFLLNEKRRWLFLGVDECMTSARFWVCLGGFSTTVEARSSVLDNILEY